MNIPLRQKLLFCFTSGLLFAMINSLTNLLLLDKAFRWELFVFNAVFFGLIFGFGFLYFMKRSTSSMMKHIQVELEENEQLQHEGAANLFKGVESVGGKLVLTNRRLIFKSHRFNFQTGETAFSWEEIDDVTPRKTAKWLQNGLRIVLKTGDHVDLVVYERDVWLDHIKTSLQKAV